MIIILAPKAQLAVDTLSLNPPPKLTIEAEYGAFVCEGSQYTSAHHQPIGSPYVGRHLDPTFGKPAPCNDQNIPILDENDVVLISHIDLDTIGGLMRASGKYEECFAEVNSEFWEFVEKADVTPKFKYESSIISKAFDKAKAKLESIVDDKLLDYPVYNNSDVTEIISLICEEVKQILTVENRNERTFITLTPFSLILRKSDGEPCNDLFTDPDGVSAIAVISHNNSPKGNSITLSLNDISEEDINKGLSCLKIAQELWGESAKGNDLYASSPQTKEISDQDFKNSADFFSKKIVSILYSFEA